MRWEDVARRQAGAVHRRQLRELGISARAVDGMVARRDLLTVAHGVYAARAAPESQNRRDWIAVLWSGGVLSHWSAARYHQVLEVRSMTVHITVADKRFRKHLRNVRLHRVPLSPSEETRSAGMPVTTRQRTVIDLLRCETYRTARDLRDRAIRQGWIDGRTILRAVLREPGRTGNVQLRRLYDEIVAGAQAESERMLHVILRSSGVRGWLPQYRVQLGGRVAYIDVALPEFKIAIEVDGRDAHGPWSDRFADDRARQNDLVAAGWRVLRFTWEHLQDPGYVLGQIAQLLAA